MSMTHQSVWGIGRALRFRAFMGAPRRRRELRERVIVPRIARLAREESRRSMSPSVFVGGVVLLVLFSGLGFLYIRQVVSTASSGYNVSLLERRAEALRVEEAKLQLATAELESLERVQERLPALHLVPVTRTVYTAPLHPASDTVVTGQIPVGTARP